jgi:hypothetical protein
MYVFTLWDNKTNPSGLYLDCINNLLLTYPELVVERFDCPSNATPDKYSSIVRLKRLASIQGDALYIDADCMAGIRYTGCNCMSFIGLRSYIIDLSVIYKPLGYEEECLRILKEYKGHIQIYVNEHRSRYNNISGYPNDKYFKHLRLTNGKNI